MYEYDEDLNVTQNLRQCLPVAVLTLVKQHILSTPSAYGAVSSRKTQTNKSKSKIATAKQANVKQKAVVRKKEPIAQLSQIQQPSVTNVARARVLQAQSAHNLGTGSTSIIKPTVLISAQCNTSLDPRLACNREKEPGQQGMVQRVDFETQSSVLNRDTGYSEAMVEQNMENKVKGKPTEATKVSQPKRGASKLPLRLGTTVKVSGSGFQMQVTSIDVDTDEHGDVSKKLRNVSASIMKTVQTWKESKQPEESVLMARVHDGNVTDSSSCTTAADRKMSNEMTKVQDVNILKMVEKTVHVQKGHHGLVNARRVSNMIPSRAIQMNKGHVAGHSSNICMIESKTEQMDSQRIAVRSRRWSESACELRNENDSPEIGEKKLNPDIQKWLTQVQELMGKSTGVATKENANIVASYQTKNVESNKRTKGNDSSKDIHSSQNIHAKSFPKSCSSKGLSEMSTHTDLISGLDLAQVEYDSPVVGDRKVSSDDTLDDVGSLSTDMGGASQDNSVELEDKMQRLEMQIKEQIIRNTQAEYIDNERETNQPGMISIKTKSSGIPQGLEISPQFVKNAKLHTSVRSPTMGAARALSIRDYRKLKRYPADKEVFINSLIQKRERAAHPKSTEVKTTYTVKTKDNEIKSVDLVKANDKTVKLTDRSDTKSIDTEETVPEKGIEDPIFIDTGMEEKSNCSQSDSTMFIIFSLSQQLQTLKTEKQKVAIRDTIKILQHQVQPQTKLRAVLPFQETKTDNKTYTKVANKSDEQNICQNNSTDHKVNGIRESVLTNANSTDTTLVPDGLWDAAEGEPIIAGFDSVRCKHLGKKAQPGHTAQTSNAEAQDNTKDAVSAILMTTDKTQSANDTHAQIDNSCTACKLDNQIENVPKSEGEHMKSDVKINEPVGSSKIYVTEEKSQKIETVTYTKYSAFDEEPRGNEGSHRICVDQNQNGIGKPLSINVPESKGNITDLQTKDTCSSLFKSQFHAQKNEQPKLMLTKVKFHSMDHSLSDLYNNYRMQSSRLSEAFTSSDQSGRDSGDIIKLTEDLITTHLDIEFLISEFNSHSYPKDLLTYPDYILLNDEDSLDLPRPLSYIQLKRAIDMKFQIAKLSEEAPTESVSEEQQKLKDLRMKMLMTSTLIPDLDYNISQTINMLEFVKTTHMTKVSDFWLLEKLQHKIELFQGQVSLRAGTTKESLALLDDIVKPVPTPKCKVALSPEIMEVIDKHTCYLFAKISNLQKNLDTAIDREVSSDIIMENALSLADFQLSLEIVVDNFVNKYEYPSAMLQCPQSVLLPGEHVVVLKYPPSKVLIEYLKELTVKINLQQYEADVSSSHKDQEIKQAQLVTLKEHRKNMIHGAKLVPPLPSTTCGNDITVLKQLQNRYKLQNESEEKLTFLTEKIDRILKEYSRNTYSTDKRQTVTATDALRVMQEACKVNSISATPKHLHERVDSPVFCTDVCTKYSPIKKVLTVPKETENVTFFTDICSHVSLVKQPTEEVIKMLKDVDFSSSRRKILLDITTECVSTDAEDVRREYELPETSDVLTAGDTPGSVYTDTDSSKKPKPVMTKHADSTFTFSEIATDIMTPLVGLVDTDTYTEINKMTSGQFYSQVKPQSLTFKQCLEELPMSNLTADDETTEEYSEGTSKDSRSDQLFGLDKRKGLNPKEVASKCQPVSHFASEFVTTKAYGHSEEMSKESQLDKVMESIRQNAEVISEKETMTENYTHRSVQMYGVDFLPSKEAKIKKYETFKKTVNSKAVCKRNKDTKSKSTRRRKVGKTIPVLSTTSDDSSPEGSNHKKRGSIRMGHTWKRGPSFIGRTWNCTNRTVSEQRGITNEATDMETALKNSSNYTKTRTTNSQEKNESEEGIDLQSSQMIETAGAKGEDDGGDKRGVSFMYPDAKTPCRRSPKLSLKTGKRKLKTSPQSSFVKFGCGASHSKKGRLASLKRLMKCGGRDSNNLSHISEKTFISRERRKPENIEENVSSVNIGSAVKDGKDSHVNKRLYQNQGGHQHRVSVVVHKNQLGQNQEANITVAGDQKYEGVEAGVKHHHRSISDVALQDLSKTFSRSVLSRRSASSMEPIRYQAGYVYSKYAHPPMKIKVSLGLMKPCDFDNLNRKVVEQYREFCKCYTQWKATGQDYEHFLKAVNLEESRKSYSKLNTLARKTADFHVCLESFITYFESQNFPPELLKVPHDVLLPNETVEQLLRPLSSWQCEYLKYYMQRITQLKEQITESMADNDKCEREMRHLLWQRAQVKVLLDICLL